MTPTPFMWPEHLQGIGLSGRERFFISATEYTETGARHVLNGETGSADSPLCWRNNSIFPCECYFQLSSQDKAPKVIN